MTEDRQKTNGERGDDGRTAFVRRRKTGSRQGTLRVFRSPRRDYIREEQTIE